MCRRSWTSTSSVAARSSACACQGRSESLAAASEEAKQREEQIHEVEVEHQRAAHAQAGRAGVAGPGVHLTKLLRVIGGQAGENDHAGARPNEGEAFAVPEQLDHAGDHYPEQADEKKASPGAEILLGQGCVGAQCPESAGGEQKRLADRAELEGEEDRR